MGYCNRCGEISTDGKCRKCGGRPVAGIVAIRGQMANSTDKWKARYTDSILPGPSPLESSKSTPLARKTPSRPALSLWMQNSCANCKESLTSVGQSFVYGDAKYCKDCHVKLQSKGQCFKCEKPIFPQQDVFIIHGGHYWHKECLTCQYCHVKMGDESAVDTLGEPCCHSCRLKQHRANTPAIVPPRLSLPANMRTMSTTNTMSTASTPVLSPVSPVSHYTDDTLSSTGSWIPRPTRHVRPSLDSHLFHAYQKSVNEPLQVEDERHGEPWSPLPDLGYSSSPSASPFSERSTPSPPMPDLQRTPSPSAELQKKPLPIHQHFAHETAASGIPKQELCHACNQVLCAPLVTLPLPTGKVRFHRQCVKCYSCGDPFRDPSVVTDGKHIYHPKCQPKSHVNAMTSARTKYTCHVCHKTITDRMLQNGIRYYHPQCFQCHACHTVLPHDRDCIEIHNEPYCERCGQRQTSSAPAPAKSTSSPLLASPRPPDHPSSIFMQRKSALPKLGGTKKCPRCQTSIAIMDGTSGPRGTRWHKKCLRCAGCRKQLDEDAKVTETPHGQWLVHCSICKNKRETAPHFVR